MNQPTLIDIAILLALVGSVLGACHRGIGREMLHTVMFAILVAVGYVLFKNQSEASSGNDVVFWLVNSTYYMITAYVLTWVGMKVLAPLVLGGESLGLRSRFWAGVLCMAKLATVILGLNLWFAINSPDVHPKRLNALPALMRDSVFVQLSDKFTDDLYRWLAAKQVIEYRKSIDREPTLDEERKAELERMLGVSATDLRGESK